MSLKPLGWLSLVLLVALPAAAGAEVVDLPPLPQRNPLRAPVEAKPVLPEDQPTVPWTEAEIGAATAKCKELLTEDPLDYELLPPIKEGLCGTPAPVLLRAVGQEPKVRIEPPATLSCPMADVLGEWLRDTVQPEAKTLFGSAVVKIQNASSYVCRNRYGGAHTLLSEHALANAFDVSQFVLADGTRITVLDHWPHIVTKPPESAPDPASDGKSVSSKPFVKPKGGDRGEDAVTPAKADAEGPPSPPPVATEPVPDPASDGKSVSSNPFVKPKGGDRGEDAVTPAKADAEGPPSPPPVATEPVPDPASDGKSVSSNPFVKPKGGDRGEDVVTPAKADAEGLPSPPPVATEPVPDPKSQFVTFLFEDACRRFGTVLGPNANAAHKDHFHLDMKKRRKSNFCE